MSDLTEAEVIDRLKQSLREAGEASLALAGHPYKGVAYKALRDNLLLVEGCCRQLCYMREDYRWITLGGKMGEAHRRSLNWIRGRKRDDGSRAKLSASERHPLFDALAQNLAFMLASVDMMLTKRTGVMGKLLPTLPAAERKVGAPVPVSVPKGMTKTKGGLLLPGTVH